MKIALDVDGVLADVIYSWLDYNNKIRKPNYKKPSYRLEFLETS